MTYKEKIEKAKQMIEEYNTNQTDESAEIDADAFVKALTADGGVSDEALQDCSYEDLQRYGIKATLLAKGVAKIFREKGESKDRKEYVSSKRAERMITSELLGVYEPRDADNPVGQELIKRSKGMHCIVFTASGKVDVVTSQKLFEEIREGYKERETMLVEGRPQKVYKIGQRPDMLADENPLYPGRRLYPDGTCDQTNRSWDGVPYEVRVLLYLARTKTGELEVSHSTVHDIIDLAISSDAETKIRQRYVKASVLYDELQEQGNLPSLKLAVNGSDGSVGGGKPNNPFPEVKVS